MIYFGYFPSHSRSSYLTGEGVGHLGEGLRLRLMEPKFLFVRAVDLWYEELDNLGDKLALLPGDGLAALLARPHLHTVIGSC